MNNKLGLISLLSVITLITTYFMSTSRIDKMFNLGELEINQVDGPAVTRDLNESFNAEEKIKENSFNKAKNNFAEIENVLVNMETEIDSLSRKCTAEIESYFKNKDIIDPNSNFYQDFRNIDKGISFLRSVLDNYILRGVIFNSDIQQIIEQEKLNTKLIKKIARINDSLDLCNVSEMDNFIITSMESMSTIERTEKERRDYKDSVIKLITPFLKLKVHDSTLYRGIGILKLAYQNEILKIQDKEYVDNMHIMLEERRDELQYQTKNLNDLERLSDFLLEEYQWRDDFTFEIAEYFAQNHEPSDIGRF